MVGAVGALRIVRGAVLVIAAGVAVAKATRRREGALGRAPLLPGRPPESAAGPGSAVQAPPEEEVAMVEVPLAEEIAEVDEPATEEVPEVEEPSAEELAEVEERTAVERSAVEEPPPVEEPPIEPPPIQEPPVEEPPVDGPPVDLPDEQPPEVERPAAQRPPASVTDIVDDLLAPDRDRDTRIEDANVVEGPSGSDPERRARP